MISVRRRLPHALVVIIALVSGVLFIGSSGPSIDDSRDVIADADVTSTTPSTTIATTTTTEPTTTSTVQTTTTKATTTTVRKVTTTKAPTTTKVATTLPPTTIARTTTTAAPPSPPPPPAGGLAAYSGVGTWVDAFDFDPAHSNNRPPVKPDAVAAMAAAGARTLYIQAARSEDPDAPGDLMSPELLAQFLTGAHAQGMRVVAWYLPKFANPAEEQRHLAAILNFSADGHRFDGVGLDIEWRAGVPDVALRNARLVELSQWLRSVAGGIPLGAIVVTPVVTDVVNTNFWPDFPWAEIAPSYDVWMTMGYWSDRKSDSPYRDAYTNATETIRLLRSHVGNVAIHPVGGIGNQSTEVDYSRFAAACNEAGVIGRSIYDWATGGAKGVTTIG